MNKYDLYETVVEKSSLKVLYKLSGRKPAFCDTD